jgi:hypothetical protein
LVPRDERRRNSWYDAINEWYVSRKSIVDCLEMELQIPTNAVHHNVFELQTLQYGKIHAVCHAAWRYYIDLNGIWW